MNCYIKLLTVTIVAIILSACATTKFTGVWTNENYKGGPIKSIMVVGVAKNERNRNIFETAVAKAFSEQGVRAVTSVKTLDGKKPSKENVIEAAKANQIQAVLVTRLVGVTEEQVYNPPTAYAAPYPYYYRWNSYYPHMYDYVGSPGYYTTYQNVHLETNIYDVTGKQLIWSAASETFNPEDVNDVVNELAEKFVEQLKSDKLI
jgi:hypothetical protein